MEKLLVEGYQAAAKESLAITEEFESADFEVYLEKGTGKLPKNSKVKAD